MPGSTVVNEMLRFKPVQALLFNSKEEDYEEA